MIRKIFLLGIFFLFCSATVTLAQKNVTSMWPYKYPDFLDGIVYFKNQKPLSERVNIHLLKSTLHYLEGDQIKEATTSAIVYVLINNSVQDVSVPDRYYMYDDQLVRLVSGDSSAFVAELVLVDFSVKERGGAYGASSSVQGTRDLSSLPNRGISSTSEMELKNKKDEGELLSVSKKYFMIVGGKVYPATRKEIESKLPADRKDAFKQFIKKNKISWKDPVSLATLLEFLKNVQ